MIYCKHSFNASEAMLAVVSSHKLDLGMYLSQFRRCQTYQGLYLIGVIFNV